MSGINHNALPVASSAEPYEANERRYRAEVARSFKAVEAELEALRRQIRELQEAAAP